MIRAEGDPAVSLVPNDALQLADRAQSIGERDLADRIAEAANKARRYQKSEVRGQ